jgi:hypothetical protein
VNIDYKASPTITAFMNSNARYRFILGPFGSGKTTGTIMEMIRRATMQAPSPIDGKRKTRIAVIRNTAPQLNDTVIKSFLAWFPSGTLGVYTATGKTYRIRQGDVECDIIFRALDAPEDVSNLLSLELTMAELSEFRELAREITEGLDGRVGRYPGTRDGGCTYAGIFGDSNMPMEGSWWYRMLEGYDPDDAKTKKPNNWEVFKQPAAMLKQVDGTYIPNPLAENTENLPADYYQRLVEGKSEEYVRTFVLCEYGRSAGGKPVHPAFNRELHVSKTPLIPDKNSVLLISADFGLTPAIVLMQQNAWGQVVVLDEIVTFGMGIERAIEEKLLPLMRQRFDGFDAQVTGDPSGATGSQSDETSCLQVFQRYRNKGLGKTKLAWSNNPIHRQGALDYFLTRLVGQGKPAFLIDPRCEWLIAALSGKYAFKKFKDGRESAEVEKSDWSHVAEALQYGAMWFERGGRRKAELNERGIIRAPQNVNPYATPR